MKCFKFDLLPPLLGHLHKKTNCMKKHERWYILQHQGLEETSNTLSSGQHNAELGVETTWMAPPAPGPESECGTCVLHRANRGHVVQRVQVHDHVYIVVVLECFVRELHVCM